MPAQSKVMDEAFVTLATSDCYALGALVLSSSLRRVNTNRQLVVMVTPGVSQTMRDQLLYAFDAVVHVNVLDSNDSANLTLLGRPDLGLTFTKLHCWRLTQYSKCVFMDADTLVLKNIDDLFDREELSAAPDVGWPDCFNSGVFVYRPSELTYSKLLQFAVTTGSFDGGDQGLLNQYFSDWASKDISKHLPFIYNVVGHSFYSYLPAFFQFGQATKVAHFIGAVKPWHMGYNKATNCVESGDARHIADFVYIWWRIFMEDVHHKLLGDLPSLVNVFERHPPPPPPPPVYHAPPPPSPPAEPINYHMVSPYVPPNIPVYYEPPAAPQHHHQPAAPVEQQYIEPAGDGRPYTHMESFYSEPPMTHTDGYTRPDVAYQARDVCQTWTELSQQQHEPEPQPQEQHHEEHHDHHHHHEEPPPPPLPPVTEEPEIPHETAPPVAAAAEEAPANLDTFTKDKLDDHQHQLNWEHGQIDYLGVDSFDNIMKQIDAVITTPPQQPAPRRSASDGNVPTFKTSTSPAASPGTKGKRRPASVIDTSDGAGEPVFEPELAPRRVKPVEGAIGSIGVEHLLGADEPEAGTERKELVVRLPAARRQELISPAQLVAQEPGIDRLLARVSAGKPTVPRRARAVAAPVERVERVIRAAGKRQEIISPEELASLTASPVVNGSRASRAEAINRTVSKPTPVSSSPVQSRTEPVASKPPESSFHPALSTDGHSSKIVTTETPATSTDGVAMAAGLPSEPLRADTSIRPEADISQSAAAPSSAAQPAPASGPHSTSDTPPPAAVSVPTSAAQPAAAAAADTGRGGHGKAKKKSHRK